MFLLSPDDWASATAGDLVRVTGPEGRHAVGVVRIRVGDEVLLSDGAGRRSTVTVTELDGQAFSARLGEVESVPEPSPRFVLVQALAKGDRGEQAIEAATELGVDEVVPWQAARSIVQWRGEKEEKGRRRWESLVVAATKQSRRARVPVVAPLVRQAALRDRVADAALALVLHEDATEPLAGVELPIDGEVVLIVGPEGGITPDEIDAFRAVGGRPVRLGGEVLRSSSAGPAALAVLNSLTRWR